MSNNGDEDLERRLRDVLSSRGLGVPVSADAIGRIHAGARRRQQRRTGASALGAVAIIAIAAIAIGVRPHSHGSTLAAHKDSPSPTAVLTSSPTASPPVSPSPPTSASPAVSVSASAVVVPPTVASSPQAATAAPSFLPLSVSAVGPKVYWALGSIPCAADRCAALEYTADGGATFSRVGKNGGGGDMPPVPKTFVNGTTVRDVRFGDTKNGWLYGGAFYTTRDGGSTWNADTSLPDDVIDVAAANGDVWAVALSPQIGSESYVLYHSRYGSSGTGTWARVQLGATLVSQPSLAVIKTTAYLVEGEAAHQVTYVITNGGSSYTARPGPCATAPTLGTGQLSVAGDGSLWAWCTAGHESGVYVSVDGAVHWQGMIRTTTTSLGGIDSSHVVVSDGTSVGTLTLGRAVTTPAIPATSTQPDATFIGFTTTRLGFIVNSAGTAALWRTTDGGQTWVAVTF